MSGRIVRMLGTISGIAGFVLFVCALIFGAVLFGWLCWTYPRTALVSLSALYLLNLARHRLVVTSLQRQLEACQSQYDVLYQAHIALTELEACGKNGISPWSSTGTSTGSR